MSKDKPKRRTHVPALTPIEFKQIIEKFSERGAQHDRIANIIVSDPSVLTKDMTRLNKTKLLSVYNEGLPESQQISSRKLDELFDELKRCFEEY